MCAHMKNVLVVTPSAANLGEDVSVCLLRQAFPNSSKGRATYVTSLESTYVCEVLVGLRVAVDVFL